MGDKGRKDREKKSRQKSAQQDKNAGGGQKPVERAGAVDERK